MHAIREIRARGIVQGSAVGPALHSPEGLSLVGDLDIGTGRIVNRESSIEGETVAGTVLILPRSVGSAGAWRFLYQLFVHRTNPVAIVIMTSPDPSLVQGAILAGIPIVSEPSQDLTELIPAGTLLRVDGTRGIIQIVGSGPA